MAAYIDKLFRRYGEEFFGKTAMDMVTDEQVSEARCAAFQTTCELTEKYGKQEKGTTKELFCNYVFGCFM